MAHLVPNETLQGSQYMQIVLSYPFAGQTQKLKLAFELLSPHPLEVIAEQM